MIGSDCSQCTQGFESDWNLRVHLKKNHQDSKRISLSCHHCQKKFGGKRALKRHIYSVHENLKSFSCSDCQAANFYSAAKLLNHYETVHGRRQTFPCPRCLMVFGTRQNLVKHGQLDHVDRQPIVSLKEMSIPKGARSVVIIPSNDIFQDYISQEHIE